MNNTKQNTIILPHLPILIIALILAVLTSCILSPVYTQIDNDITLMHTVLPTILDALIILFESLYIALLCAVATYSVYGIRKGTESLSLSIISVVSVIFLKHALNLTVSTIIDGYIDVIFDIPVTLMLFAADLLLVAVVALVADNKFKKHFSHAKKIAKAAKHLNTVEYSELGAIYPFEGFLNLKNAMLVPIFTGAVISTSMLILQRLYADIIVIGAPQSIYEIIEIVVFYTFDILVGLASYTASYFAAKFIFIKLSAQESQE